MESGKDRKPVLGDLRESGQLEHDGDIVILLHREMLGTELECIIAKNRSGSPGIVDLEFYGETMSVTGGPV
jgi:replicative DNA helicase